MTGVVGEVDALARLRRTARPEAAHARQGAGQRRQAESGQACSRAALRGSKTVGGRGVSVAHGCLRGRRGKMALQGRGGMRDGAWGYGRRPEAEDRWLAAQDVRASASP